MVWYPEMMGRTQLLTGEGGGDGGSGGHEVDEATKQVAAEVRTAPPTRELHCDVPLKRCARGDSQECDKRNEMTIEVHQCRGLVHAMSGELMSFRTAKNIAHNKDNIDYCIDQFNYISNRIKCIRLMTGNGPYLS
eukprot:89734-Hanusia_phi.AAC.1